MATDGLSTAAIRLLQELRSQQELALQDGRPVTHLTDRQLAALCGLPHRDIIDAADELLVAGVLVCADGAGRWLGAPPDGRRYQESLGLRARKILVRRRHVRDVLRSRGQLTLSGWRP